MYQVLEGDVSGETAMTAVKNAISNHRCDVVKHLAELGCDVNMTDADGWYVPCTGVYKGEGGWAEPASALRHGTLITTTSITKFVFRSIFIKVGCVNDQPRCAGQLIKCR